MSLANNFQETSQTSEDAVKRAREEFEREQFRAEVDAYKAKLRAAKWWHKLIPFTIRIERRK